MKKQDITINELVEMICKGELKLPEMQRKYVWRASRVRDLLDSLYRGYPSGSILVWETDVNQPSKDMAVQQSVSPFTGHKLLLDGQQRLTSLTAVIKGEPIKVRDRKRPIDILFNLDHPENNFEFTEVESDITNNLMSEDENEIDDEIEDETENLLMERMKNKTFMIASKTLAQCPNWVSVTEVFKSKDYRAFYQKLNITDIDDPRLDKYSNRLNNLKSIINYRYSMNILSNKLSYEEVAEIFVRVNSLGVKLRGSDLALAQITARWNNSLELFEDYQRECEKSWMTLDLGLLVRTMVVFATQHCRFAKVSSTSIKDIQNGWEKAKRGLNYAINFMRSNAKIEDESLLSSPYFFIVIAYYSQIKNENISTEESKQLLYWLYIANAKGRYSRGSSETLLDEDLDVINKGSGPAELIALLEQQFGRLSFEASDFKKRGAGTSLFSMVFIALKENGALDWYTGLGLSLSHQGQYHYIQYHHIFPKSLLKDKYDPKEINEIANLAFISGKTNKQISNKKPDEYLRDIINKYGTDAVEKQAVTTDENLLKLDKFIDFIEKRRVDLAKRLNEFVDKIRK